MRLNIRLKGYVYTNIYTLLDRDELVMSLIADSCIILASESESLSLVSNVVLIS